MQIPNDPIILLSYVNNQLRDNYSSFEEMCKSLCVSPNEIKNKLASLNYEYDSKLNKFI